MSKAKAKVRLEVSPYADLGRTKIKQRIQSVGTSGQLLERMGPDGKKELIKEDVDVINLVALPGTSRTLSPLITKNGLDTGLNAMVPNPYAKLPHDSDYFPEWGIKKLKDKDMILLQTKLEYEHNVPFDFYRPKFAPVQTPRFDTDDVPYFARPDARMTVTNNTTFLDLSDPRDELRYYWLKRHPKVANSFKELEANPSDYKFYLTEEGEKESVQASSAKIMLKVNANLAELVDNDVVIVSMAKILNAPGEVDADASLLYLQRFIATSADNINEFSAWFKRYKDAGTRKEFEAAALLSDYVNAGIIRRRDRSYFFDIVNDTTGVLDHLEFGNRELLIQNFFLENDDLRKAQREVLKGRYQDWLTNQAYYK